MKGEKTLRILEALYEAPQESGPLFELFFGGYSGSYRAAREIVYGSGKRPGPAEDYRRRQRLSRLVSYLCKQGLVRRNSSGTLRVTQEGVSKMKRLRRGEERVMRRETTPGGKAGRESILVMFDIPEEWRWKRRWLREQLVVFGFEMIQQSVWMGVGKLPEEFIRRLYDLNLAPHVEIMRVVNKGTVL